MTRNILRAGLLASASLVAACGGGDKEAAAPAAVEKEVADAAADAALAIPDAPESPLAEINAKKSDEFFAANGARDGVLTLESGLQIETTTPGTGDVPGENDFIRFHYTGKFIDGTVFDDSTTLESPLVIPSFNAIPIPGLPGALAQMKEGEKATVAVPPALAFGEEGLPGLFEPNQTLLFDLQVFEIITEAEEDRRAEIIAEQEQLMAEQQAQQQAEQQAAMEALEKTATENLAAATTFLEGTATKAGVTVTESGLQYEVLEDGGQGATPNPWDTVRVHYKGTLPDGTQFDSSYDRGEPTEFPLNRVISGWTEGVALMNVGDKYKFYIPPALGYGEQGTPGGPIGPNAALVFEVELLNIEPGVAPDAPATDQ